MCEAAGWSKRGDCTQRCGGTSAKMYAMGKQTQGLRLDQVADIPRKVQSYGDAFVKATTESVKGSREAFQLIKQDDCDGGLDLVAQQALEANLKQWGEL